MTKPSPETIMNSDQDQGRTVFITAGEASGDLLGSSLMKALKAKSERPIAFQGVGGDLMGKEGLQSIFPMNDLSVMGIMEVIPRLRKILRRIKQTSDYIKENRPDVVVTIDSPDFSFRVTRQLHDTGYDASNIVHYVAPTVWAWREERAAKLAGLYNGVLCLYPCEPPYFEKHELSAPFIGHPVIEQPYERTKADVKRIRKDLGIADDVFVIGVLFGSRMGELTRIGHTIRQAIRAVARKQGKGKVHVVSLTLPHLKVHVDNLLATFPCPVTVCDDATKKWDIYGVMQAAVSVSGTAGLELSVADVPHCIAYKMNALTAHIVKKKIKIDRAHLTNILLQDDVIPEYIQENCKQDNIIQALERLVIDSKAREDQQASFKKLRKLLQADSKKQPSEMAAEYILSLLDK